MELKRIKGNGNSEISAPHCFLRSKILRSTCGDWTPIFPKLLPDALKRRPDSVSPKSTTDSDSRANKARYLLSRFLRMPSFSHYHSTIQDLLQSPAPSGMRSKMDDGSNYTWSQKHGPGFECPATTIRIVHAAHRRYEKYRVGQSIPNIVHRYKQL